MGLSFGDAKAVVFEGTSSVEPAFPEATQGLSIIKILQVQPST